MKLKVQPLVLVLAAQMIVLVAAVVFMVARGGQSTPAPRAHAEQAQAEEEAEVKPHALNLTPPPAPPGEWSEFPDKEKPAEHAAPREEKAVAAAPGHEPEHAPPVARPAEDAHAPEHAPAAAAAAEEPARGPESFEALVDQLVAGNARFGEGVTRQRDAVARRVLTSREERADAVVVTCTDSRVVPELLFDQPLGTFAVVRVPAAVVDEGAAKAVEDALKRLQPKAVLVLGHLGCHHVDHALATAPKKKAPRASTLASALGGLQAAFEGEALEAAASEASVSFALRELRRRSKAVARTEVPLLRLLYAPATGKVKWLDAEQEAPAEPAPRVGRHP